MPQITQEANTRPKQTHKTGSLLASAIDVRELGDVPLKVCIYGENRVGKTSLACEFPKPLLLISFEPAKSGGATSVRKVEGVKFKRITTSEDMYKIVEELKQDTFFKSHVLDGATSMQDVFLRELMEVPETPTTLWFNSVPDEIYKQRSEKTKEALRKFLQLDANTIVLAKEKDHNPPKTSRENKKPKMLNSMEVESYFASDVGSATAGFLHDCCDSICRLYTAKEVKEEVTYMEMAGVKEKNVEYVETGRIVHRLRTLKHPNFAAGIRSDSPGYVPEFVEGESPKILYDKLMQVIRGTYREVKK